MLSVLILFNDPRIGFVFTKQGVVWLHTVLQTRFPMMSDDGNGLNMPEAARYSLDPGIHFITHLPLPSEVCFRLSKMQYSTPLFFSSSSSLHVSSLALKTFYPHLTQHLPSPISHLPQIFPFIYISNLASHSLPLPIFPSPPKKEIFFPPYPHPILPSYALYLGSSRLVWLGGWCVRNGSMRFTYRSFFQLHRSSFSKRSNISFTLLPFSATSYQPPSHYPLAPPLPLLLLLLPLLLLPPLLSAYIYPLIHNQEISPYP